MAEQSRFHVTEVTELPLPPSQATSPENEKVPAQQAGDFFVEAPHHRFGQGRLLTPVDRFSGIPLPLSPAYMEDRPSRFKPDLHHAWHEKLDPRLQGLGGLALRHSRIQKANFDVHHIDYHSRHFQGPKLPSTDEERLRPLILGAAGYIPRQALSFDRAGNPRRVDLSNATRRKLWYSGQIKVERPAVVGRFLIDYALRQDISDISSRTIDEFLNTTNPQRRMQLGNELLGRAVRRATQPVSSAYTQAYKEKALPPDQGQTASRFVLASLGMKKNRARIHAMMRHRLAA